MLNILSKFFLSDLVALQIEWLQRLDGSQIKIENATTPITLHTTIIDIHAYDDD
jgi:hypothetical protein